MCGRFKLRRSDKAILAAKFGKREADLPDYVDELDEKVEISECSPGLIQQFELKTNIAVHASLQPRLLIGIAFRWNLKAEI